MVLNVDCLCFSSPTHLHEPLLMVLNVDCYSSPTHLCGPVLVMLKVDCLCFSSPIHLHGPVLVVLNVNCLCFSSPTHLRGPVLMGLCLSMLRMTEKEHSQSATCGQRTLENTFVLDPTSTALPLMQHSSKSKVRSTRVMPFSVTLLTFRDC